LRSIRAALDFSQGVGHIRQLNAAVPDWRCAARPDRLARRKLDIQLNTRVTDDLGSSTSLPHEPQMLAIEWP